MPRMKPQDMGALEDDMGSIEDTRGQLRPRPPMGTGAMPSRAPMGAGTMPSRPVPPVRAMANPADAGVYTADKGMPPSPDDMGSIESNVSRLAPSTPRQVKARKDVRAAMGMKSGGKVGSASKRADGIATKGKTKGRIV